MSGLPAPLVPINADCRRFRGFPINPQHVRDDDFTLMSTGAEFRAHWLLMAYAWHEVPAASLPDDDRHLARLLGYRIDKWLRIRPGALQDWVPCSDGRIYCRTLANHVGIVLSRKNLWQYGPEPTEPRITRLDVSASQWLALRDMVFERDGYVCRYCGEDEGPFDCDHVIPLIQGGKSVPENLACSCAPCNRSKGGRTVEQWKGAAQ